MVKSQTHLAGGLRHIKMTRSQRRTNRSINRHNKLIDKGQILSSYSSRIKKHDIGKMRLMKIGRKTKKSRN